MTSSCLHLVGSFDQLNLKICRCQNFVLFALLDIFMKNRPVSKMPSGSRPQITHTQLPPITTGKLRHLHDATNPLAIQY